jgi:hypothetical protein
LLNEVEAIEPAVLAKVHRKGAITD